MTLPRITAVTCPAGWYYVGDPCYAASDERWAQYGESSDWFQQSILATAPDGAWCVGLPTAYGDGEYRGTDGYAYGVDAGLLGVTPKEYAQDNALHGLRLVNFPKPFECYTKGPVVVLGHIRIDTDPELGSDDDRDDDDDECLGCGERRGLHSPHCTALDDNPW